MPGSTIISLSARPLPAGCRAAVSAVLAGAGQSSPQISRR
jgi:hypothetical protein